MKKEKAEELARDLVEKAKDKYPEGTRFKTRSGHDRISSGEFESIIEGIVDNFQFIGIRDMKSRGFVYWHDKESWSEIISLPQTKGEPEEEKNHIKKMYDKFIENQKYDPEIKQPLRYGAFDDLIRKSEPVRFTKYLSIVSHYNDDVSITSIDLDFHVKQWQEWRKLQEQEKETFIDGEGETQDISSGNNRLRKLHQELEQRLSLGMGQMLDDIRYLIEKLESDITQRKAEKRFAARNDFDIEYRSIIKTINALISHRDDLKSLVQKYDPKKPEKKEIEIGLDWGKETNDKYQLATFYIDFDGNMTPLELTDEMKEYIAKQSEIDQSYKDIGEGKS